MTKKEIRQAFIEHPGSKRIMETYFNNVFIYNENESLYWNEINFLEVIREKDLWSTLINYIK